MTYVRFLHRMLLMFAFAGLFSLTLALDVRAQSYTITDLGTLSGQRSSNAQDISDNGVVVGQSDGSNDYPFVWQSGLMMKISPLPGGESGISVALGVSNTGQVVGQSQTTPPAGQSYLQQAFSWQSGMTFALPVLPDSSTSYAQKVNNSGQIVGGAFTSDNYRAVLWQNGAVYDLGFPPNGGFDYSFAYGINNQGFIVGAADGPDGHIHPFLWTPTTTNGTSGTMTLIGPSEVGRDAFAYGINDKNQVVGSMFGSAFLYSNGTMQSLGVLSGDSSSTAFAINNASQVVGTSYGTSTRRPFLYSNGTMTDLNTLEGIS